MDPRTGRPPPAAAAAAGAPATTAGAAPAAASARSPRTARRASGDATAAAAAASSGPVDPRRRPTPARPAATTPTPDPGPALPPAHAVPVKREAAETPLSGGAGGGGNGAADVQVRVPAKRPRPETPAKPPPLPDALVAFPDMVLASLAAGDVRTAAAVTASAWTHLAATAPPPAFLYVGFAVLGRRSPTLFRDAALVGTLLSALSGVDVAASGGRPAPAPAAWLAANLLWAAFRDMPAWPAEFALAYVDDAAGDRRWVDHPECAAWVDALLTALPHGARLDEAGRVVPIAVTPDSPARFAPAAQLAVRQRLITAVQALASATPVAPLPGSGAGGLGAAAAPATQERQLLRLLLAGAGIEAVREEAAARLEGWLAATSPLQREARELRARLVQLTTGWAPTDAAVVAALVRVRLRTSPPSELEEHLGVVAQLLGRHAKYGPHALYTVVTDELAAMAAAGSAAATVGAAPTPTGAAGSAARRPVPNATAVRVLASLLVALAGQPGAPPAAYLLGQSLRNALLAQAGAPLDGVAAHVQALMERVARQLPGLRWAPLASGLFELAGPDALAAIGAAPTDAGLVLEPLVQALVPVLRLAAIQDEPAAAAAAAADGAAPSEAERPDPRWTNLRTMQDAALAGLAQLAAGAREAALGGLPVAPSAYGPLKLEDVASACRQLLFLELTAEPTLVRPEGSATVPREPPLAEYAPVDAALLFRVLDLPMPRDRQVVLLEALARRACLHQAYGHLAAASGRPRPAAGPAAPPGPGRSPLAAVTPAEAAALVGGLLELARYRPPAGLPLPPDAPENRRFAVASLYWRVWLALVALACQAPATLGALLWQRYPTARQLLEMVMTRIFQFPALLPPEAAGGAAEVLAAEAQRAQQETEAILAFECRVATAHAGKPVEVDEASSLFLAPANRLTLFDPQGPARPPPANVLAALERAAAQYRLPQALYQCRDPPYLADLVKRRPADAASPAAGAWLGRLVATDPSLLDMLPAAPIYTLALDAAEARQAAGGAVTSADGLIAALTARCQRSLHAAAALPPSAAAELPDEADWRDMLSALAHPQRPRRAAAHAVLSLACSSPGTDLGGRDGPAWLARLVPPASAGRAAVPPAWVRVLHPALVAAAAVETDAPVLQAYVHAAARLDAAPLLADLAAVLVLQRPLVAQHLLEGGSDSAQFWDAAAIALCERLARAPAAADAAAAVLDTLPALLRLLVWTHQRPWATTPAAASLRSTLTAGLSGADVLATALRILADRQRHGGAVPLSLLQDLLRSGVAGVAGAGLLAAAAPVAHLVPAVLADRALWLLDAEALQAALAMLGALANRMDAGAVERARAALAAAGASASSLAAAAQHATGAPLHPDVAALFTKLAPQATEAERAMAVDQAPPRTARLSRRGAPRTAAEPAAPATAAVRSAYRDARGRAQAAPLSATRGTLTSAPAVDAAQSGVAVVAAATQDPSALVVPEVPGLALDLVHRTAAFADCPSLDAILGTCASPARARAVLAAWLAAAPWAEVDAWLVDRLDAAARGARPTAPGVELDVLTALLRHTRGWAATVTAADDVHRPPRRPLSAQMQPPKARATPWTSLAPLHRLHADAACAAAWLVDWILADAVTAGGATLDRRLTLLASVTAGERAVAAAVTERLAARLRWALAAPPPSDGPAATAAASLALAWCDMVPSARRWLRSPLGLAVPWPIADVQQVNGGRQRSLWVDQARGVGALTAGVLMGGVAGRATSHRQRCTSCCCGCSRTAPPAVPSAGARPTCGCAGW